MGGKRLRPVKEPQTAEPGGQSARPSRSHEELLSMNKEQLKVECRKRGQRTSGTKVELLQRLGCKMSSTTTSKRKDVLLNGSAGSTTGTGTSERLPDASQSTPANEEQRSSHKMERLDRQSLVLWKKPLKTLEYSTRECVVLLRIYGNKVLEHKKIVLVSLISVLSFYLLLNSNGPHQRIVQKTYKKILWCLYWTGLGILSSVGLGTGLHTFLLYLGPHIAQVTLAAYECDSLNFPEPPYPDEIICPVEKDNLIVTIFSIMSKVRLEAMCWGAGTALGELPPYFMARAARLSGLDPDEEDEDLKEFEELQKKQNNLEQLSLVDRGKLFVEQLVQKVGFFGILACASIPNPLFDLAGITCGHFLVPFWTFFGATLIGKAVIKMHIQKLFVIIAFNETLITTALSWLRLLPYVGGKLQAPFKAFLDSQKSKLHKRVDRTVSSEGNVLGSIFEKFVIAMVLYFVVSIVNSFAQSYHKRTSKREKASRD